MHTRVQVMVAGLVPAHSDLVAAARHVLDMQWLVEVSDEMKDELEGFLAQRLVGGRVGEGGRLLVDGGYNAAFLLFTAVGRVVHGALFGGRVAGILDDVSSLRLA